MDPESKQKWVRISHKGDLVHIRFVESNIVGTECTEQLHYWIDQIIKQIERPKVLIDFEHVLHISSIGLSELLSGQKRLVRHQGQVRLVNIGMQVAEIFHIARLNEIFTIYDDIDAATRSFR